MWGQPCLAYNIQALFDEESLARLADVQDRVRRRCGGIMRPTPPHTMHVSVFSIIPARWVSNDKEAIWKRLEPLVRQELSVEAANAVSIRFLEIRIAPSALILSTPHQPGPIHRLRDRLNALAASVDFPTQTFDRTHLTLARPDRDGTMDPAVVAEVEATPAVVDVQVRAIRLIRETVYPSLEIDVLA
ncbi:hypothetical protein [Caulobacter sp. DWR1-3-2b1]|uniref:hypothetical protein n=1 Tax=Caulobacter sp. DWR1-3-2b1 TaxID=2804670 RepID=UPI003CF3D877